MEIPFPQVVFGGVWVCWKGVSRGSSGWKFGCEEGGSEGV